MLLSEIARKQIEEFAKARGFHSVGFVPCENAETFPAFCDWLDRGYAASMGYLEKRKEAYRNPAGVLPECRTAVLLTLPYQGHPGTKSVTKQGKKRNLPVQSEPTFGSYAAAAEDYHIWIRRKLKPLVRELHTMFPHCQTRAVVDTAPLLERHYAHRAGLGWIGKNTMLLNRQIGSYFFLCAILTEADLAGEVVRQSTSHCGTCTACMDACPTGAFVSPYVLDANRCISYWTIEHQGQVPESVRPLLGPWIFGCDICQMVCPWNQPKHDTTSEEIKPFAVEQKSDCSHWLSLDQESFKRLYRNTPFWRTGLLRMQRNALIVAANLRVATAYPWIQQFTNHPIQDLRELAHWALEQYRAPTNQESL
jgi:epoxyqueuosine reductase